MTAIKEKFKINNKASPETEGYRLYVKCINCNREERFFSKSQAKEAGWRFLKKKEGLWGCPDCKYKRKTIYLSMVDFEFAGKVLINQFGFYSNFCAFARIAIRNQLEIERKKVKDLLIINKINKFLENSEYELNSLPDIKKFKIIEKVLFPDDNQ